MFLFSSNSDGTGWTSHTGGFVVSLSNEYYLSTDGEWYEGLGIPVDVEVEQFTAYERSEEVDLSVEAAIAWLSEQE